MAWSCSQAPPKGEGAAPPKDEGAAPEGGGALLDPPPHPPPRPCARRPLAPVEEARGMTWTDLVQGCGFGVLWFRV